MYERLNQLESEKWLLLVLLGQCYEGRDVIIFHYSYIDYGGCALDLFNCKCEPI